VRGRMRCYNDSDDRHSIVFAVLVCLVALLLPYRARVAWYALVPSPFICPTDCWKNGKIHHGYDRNAESIRGRVMAESREACAVLFSGGTDSTCVAGLCAEKFSTVHLLTFHELATGHSPVPQRERRALTNALRPRQIYSPLDFDRSTRTQAVLRELRAQPPSPWLFLARNARV